MRGVSSGNGRDAALSRQQPIKAAGKHRPPPSGVLPYIARRVAAAPVAGRVAACLAVAAAAILIGASASPASAPAGGWSITPSPIPRVPTGQLFWVSCPTAHSCMAVGTYVKASGIGVNLAEQWNGTSWRILRTPNPSGMAVSGLFGVACTSSSACMAVGASTTNAGTARTLAERWDGTRWTIQATPNRPPGGFLNGVACTSASACTAVGSSAAGTLAERWNGTRWAIQSTPNPSQGGGGLSGVACTSASACTAVGGSNAGALAERWNGTRWSIQSTPNPAQGGGFLTSVACMSASACTAVGLSNAGTLAERWNGIRWSLQPTPTPAGAQFAFLNTVACTSPSACTAAGAYTNASGVFRTLAEHWNGTAWHRQATPNQGPSLLIGLTCTSAAACTAVGYSTTNQSPAVLVERSAGASWRTQAAPNPPGAASSSLNGVACASRSACTAVGATTSRSRTVATLAEQWNGHTWRIQPTPSPTGGGALNSVSCAWRSACTAVGGTADGATLAEQRIGTTWTIRPTPNPAGAAQSFLLAVSCTSPSACIAAGAYSTTSSEAGPFRSLAEQWNGKKWTILPTPNPAKALQSFLNGVSCTSPSACTAIGEQHSAAGIVHTVAERWDGATWRIQHTANPPGVQFATLAGVSCTGPSACLATGGSDQGTLAERWNGTAWRIQHTPNRPGGQDILLASVACPAPSACTAFGFDENSSGQHLTLAERWNGRTWRIQPTPGIVAADIGLPGVACPTLSACVAVAGYTNNGPNLPLAELWDRPDSDSQPVTSHPAVRHGSALACARSPLSIAASAWRPNLGSAVQRAHNHTDMVFDLRKHSLIRYVARVTRRSRSPRSAGRAASTVTYSLPRSSRNIPV
jgi:hypothetical protein